MKNFPNFPRYQRRKYIDADIKYETIDALIEYLTKLKEDGVPGHAELDMDYSDYHQSIEAQFAWSEPETDEEYRARYEFDLLQQEKKLEADRKLFEELKKKFEKFES